MKQQGIKNILLVCVLCNITTHLWSITFFHLLHEDTLFNIVEQLSIKEAYQLDYIDSSYCKDVGALMCINKDTNSKLSKCFCILSTLANIQDYMYIERYLKCKERWSPLPWYMFHNYMRPCKDTFLEKEIMKVDVHFYDKKFLFEHVFSIVPRVSSDHVYLQLKFCYKWNRDMQKYGSFFDMATKNQKKDIRFFKNLIKDLEKEEAFEIDLSSWLIQDIAAGLVSVDYNKLFLVQFFSRSRLFRNSNFGPLGGILAEILRKNTAGVAAERICASFRIKKKSIEKFLNSLLRKSPFARQNADLLVIKSQLQKEHKSTSVVSQKIKNCEEFLCLHKQLMEKVESEYCEAIQYDPFLLNELNKICKYFILSTLDLYCYVGKITNDCRQIEFCLPIDGLLMLQNKIDYKIDVSSQNLLLLNDLSNNNNEQVKAQVNIISKEQVTCYLTTISTKAMYGKYARIIKWFCISFVLYNLYRLYSRMGVALKFA
ncbi:MAG TPA: hypothetical protein VL201_02130 [Patescibacteria group bacterium]|jgi:hypothetical protein|nr:hypothetical protein [Patescibacteria group bacterium]